MELSMNAIEILAAKYGKGKLYGFEKEYGKYEGTISKENAERIYDELTGNELIDLSEESAHISALGHHILNMMINPEQFIMLNNQVLKMKARLYIRDAYYLCVLNYKAAPERIVIDLLPGLKEVVSAFVYAVYLDSEEEKQKINEQNECDIHVIAEAWNIERIKTSEIEICGNYDNKNIKYRSSETNEGKKQESGESVCTTSDFVNNLTKWLFARISETMTQEEN